MAIFTSSNETDQIYRKERKQPSNAFENYDLVPATDEEQDFSAWTYLAFWLAMSLSITVFLLTDDLFAFGFNWWQATLILFAGSSLVVIPFALNGKMGSDYGIPFVMALRVSFGVHGSLVVSILRGLFASVSFGIFTWLGGAILYQMVLSWGVRIDSLMTVFNGTDVAVESGALITFAFMWFIQLAVAMLGIRTLKYLFYTKAIVLSIYLAVLLIWGGITLKTGGPLLTNDPFGKTQTLQQDTSLFVLRFFGGVATMLSYWFIYSLSISDYTRYAKSNNAQVIGQAVGIPLFTTALGFAGIVLMSYYCAAAGITSAAELRQLTMAGVYNLMQNPIFATFFTVLFAFGISVTNVALNLVTAALCFSNMCPNLLNYRGGLVIAAIVSALVCPWWLASSINMITPWLTTMGCIFSGVIGIMIIDFYGLKKQSIDPEDLSMQHGRYWYVDGFNVHAFVAWFLSIAINIPGILAQMKVIQVDWLQEAFYYSWLIGFAVGAVVYVIGMLAFPMKPYFGDMTHFTSNVSPYPSANMMEVGSPIGPEDSVSAKGF
jgi:NCS1 family nucleobase:cation symporter-1